MTMIGFPHSDTPDSLCAYHSSRLFAVRCVLLQLLMPRHSPYALSNLIAFFDCFLSLNCFVLFVTFFGEIFPLGKISFFLLFSFQRSSFEKSSYLSQN